jgi:hypothetical protein
MALLRRLPVVVLALVALGWRGVAAADLTDVQLRAGYLYNFAQFVEWPQAPRQGANLLIGVIGDDAFAAAASRLLDGRNAGGRKIAVRAVDGSDELERIAMLYVGLDDDRAVATTLVRIGRAPVLTVGDSPRFTELGGIVRLYTEGAKLRFEINVNRSQHSNLRISSKLLNLASIVKDPS